MDESTVSPRATCSPVLPVLTASVVWLFYLYISPCFSAHPFNCNFTHFQIQRWTFWLWLPDKCSSFHGLEPWLY